MKKKFFCFLSAVILSFSYLVLPLQIAFASVLDLTTWTEIDPNAKITVESSDNVSWISLTRNETAYLRHNNYSNKDFHWQVAFDLSRITADGRVVIMGSSNTTVPYFNNGNCFIIELSSQAGDTYTLLMQDVLAGSPVATATVAGLSENATYYANAMGSSATMNATVSVYNDEEMTDLVGTDTLAMRSSTLSNFETSWACVTLDGNFGSRLSDGWSASYNWGISGLEPVVLTYPEIPNPTGALFLGYGSTTYGDLLTAGFLVGTESGNYTDNFTCLASAIDENSFARLVESSNFTVGQTYYFQAWARNQWGTGFGSERSFVFSAQTLAVTTNTATVIQCLSGNFSAGFTVSVNPQITDNVSARLSANYPDFSNPVTLYPLGVEYGYWGFDTWNGTYNSECTLNGTTTYYYQGFAEYEGVIYYGEVKTFTTSEPEYPDAPDIDLIRIRDVSDTYGEDYVFELTGQITTSNTTDWIINQGFRFSLTVSPTGTLLPVVYRYLAPVLAPDNTFILTLTLADATWYTGQTLYFSAFTETPYYGAIYSSVVPFTPDDTGAGGGAVVDDDVAVVSDFSEIVRDIRSNLGLHGTMGTWAFMGLILLLIAMIFGSAMFAIKEQTGRTVVGVIWALISISVVGGFIFTGELGLWPILILVGAVVVFAFMVGSIILSGRTANG